MNESQLQNGHGFAGDFLESTANNWKASLRAHNCCTKYW